VTDDFLLQHVVAKHMHSVSSRGCERCWPLLDSLFQY
jgi:hypothetical protein